MRQRSKINLTIDTLLNALNTSKVTLTDRPKEHFRAINANLRAPLRAMLEQKQSLPESKDQLIVFDLGCGNAEVLPVLLILAEELNFTLCYTGIDNNKKFLESNEMVYSSLRGSTHLKLPHQFIFNSSDFTQLNKRPTIKHQVDLIIARNIPVFREDGKTPNLEVRYMLSDVIPFLKEKNSHLFLTFMFEHEYNQFQKWDIQQIRGAFSQPEFKQKEGAITNKVILENKKLQQRIFTAPESCTRIKDQFMLSYSNPAQAKKTQNSSRSRCALFTMGASLAATVLAASVATYVHRKN